MLLTLLLIAAQTSPSTPGASDAFKFEYYRVKERLEADGSVRRTMEVSVILRAPSAVAQFGQLGLPYVKDYGDVQFNQVRVHKPDGTSRAVTDGVLEDLNPFGINDASMPVDIRFKKLTIPRLEPGDRLSYSVLLTHKPFVPGDLSGEMKFFPLPMDGPQTYELDLPAQSRIRVELRPGLGAAWETVPSDPERLVRRLSISVPPEVLKAGTRSEEQVRALQTPDVAYSTFSTWADVGSWWWRMSQAQVLADAAVRAEAARLVAGKASPREKMEALAAFVGATVRYLNVSFGMGRMQPRAAGSVLASRFGDCKDKVGLLMALADTVGIEVRPVLISASRLDIFDTVPGPHQFDHVIAVAKIGPAEKDWMWIDATTALTPVVLLPATRDKRALLIERDGRGVIVKTPAAPDIPRAIVADLKGVLDGAGIMKGRVRLTTRSDYERVLRDSFGGAAREQYPEVVKAILARTWKDARVKGVQTADLSDLANPFWFEFEFERDISGIDSTKEWKLWIPDMGPSIIEPDDDVTATKPVQFLASEVALTASVELPEGVTARAPLSVTLDRPFVSLSSKYSVEGRTLKVNRVIRFPQPFVSRDQLAAYQALKKSADTDREQEFIVGPVAAAALSAASLQKEGKAAYEKKEYPKAIELLQRAIAADPKLAHANLDLGLALRESGKFEEAIAAYSKAIEIDPYDDTVYAERAYALFELNRDAEAEKDLLKQIEVAPFKAWSYRRLAQLRRSQRRYKEAAELFTKSLAIDPSPVSDWMDLGKAHAIEGQATEARAAFAKAEQMGLETGRRTFVARGYALIGDMKAAEDLARKDLPELLEKVKAITTNDFVDEMYWTDRMVEAWGVIGSAALAKGDLDTAERFLKASWDGGMSPDDGLPLAIALTRRGKKAEAAAVLSAVITMRPSMFGRPEMPGLFKDLGSYAVNAKSDIASRLAGAIPIVTEKLPSRLTENVTILVQEGRVAAAREFSKQREAELTPLIEALVGQKAPWLDPDGKGVTIVRDGFIGCGTIGCHWFARIESAPRATTEPVDVGSIAVTRITPAKEALLLAGSTVTMKVSLDYELEGTKDGQVGLFALDDRSRQLLKLPLAKVVKPGNGALEFTFDVTVPKNATSVRVNAVLFVSAPSKTSTEVVFKVRK